MSNKQQTAVEWLYRWILDNQEATIDEGCKAFEQAKAMEKEQMIEHSFNFYYDLSNKKGVPFNLISENRILAEEYYKDTYENSKD